MIGEKQSLMKNDVLWNALGSMTYALASMVLATPHWGSSSLFWLTLEFVLFILRI